MNNHYSDQNLQFHLPDGRLLSNVILTQPAPSYFYQNPPTPMMTSVQPPMILKTQTLPQYNEVKPNLQIQDLILPTNQTPQYIVSGNQVYKIMRVEQNELQQVVSQPQTEIPYIMPQNGQHKFEVMGQIFNGLETNQVARASAEVQNETQMQEKQQGGQFIIDHTIHSNLTIRKNNELDQIKEDFQVKERAKIQPIKPLVIDPNIFKERQTSLDHKKQKSYDPITFHRGQNSKQSTTPSTLFQPDTSSNEQKNKAVPDLIQQFPEITSDDGEFNPLKRQNTLINRCPHVHRKHYAKGMCSTCYHRMGRTKMSWLCPHTDKKHYAHGKCLNCYLSEYNLIKRYKKNENEKKETSKSEESKSLCIDVRDAKLIKKQ